MSEPGAVSEQAAMSGPGVIATTTAGRVRGAVKAGSLEFRGIPYAAAPVGALMFASPQLHSPWQGVRDATANGPTPSLGPTNDNYSIPEPVVAGEEILNLNVFTPSLEPAEPLPVHVWIHGGSFVGGSPGGQWFDGGSFARDGVVTVAITYRLGFQGYGYVEDAPTNRALLDMVAALEWVQQNIGYFGGDPTRVTLAGQSAGGSAVLALLASPYARGLFHAAVCHSGPLPDIELAAAKQVGAQMTRALDLEANTKQCWQQVPREEIVAAERARDRSDLLSAAKDLHRVLRAREPISDFGPVIDGDVLPLAPLEALRTGRAADVPLMIGSTSHEFNRITSQLENFLGAGIAGALLIGLGVQPPLARAYPRAFPHFSPAELIGQAVTDRVFRIPAVAVALSRPRDCAPTWMWDFRWLSGELDRSVHCLDLPFSWDQLGAERVARLAGDEPPQALATTVHSAMVHFIQTHQAAWQPFTAEEPVAQVWDTEPWIGRDPYRFERIALRYVPITQDVDTSHDH